MLNRIFGHWKTTSAGVVIAAVLGIVAQTYKPGMSWKAWLPIAAPALIGAFLRDPGAKS